MPGLADFSGIRDRLGAAEPESIAPNSKWSLCLASVKEMRYTESTLARY